MTRWIYWTCSKFANKLRGTAKPKAASFKEWYDWEIEAKRKHPFRFWLADDCLDFIQDSLYFIPDKIKDARYYLSNRFIDKTHALTSNLKRGQYYDLDTRILNCIFDEIVNFVEIDNAQMNYSWFEENNKKYKLPCPEAGVNHLEWAASLTYNKNDGYSENDELYGKPTHQAETAKETLALYNWWKNVYPNRTDPHNIPEYKEHHDRLEKKYGTFILNHDEYTEEESELSTKHLQEVIKMEEKYDKEDEEMLIRVIKIRKSLWT